MHPLGDAARRGDAVPLGKLVPALALALVLSSAALSNLASAQSAPSQLAASACFVPPTGASWACLGADAVGADVVAGTTVYLDVSMVNSTGGVVTNTCACTAQVSLSSTGGGVLSSTAVFILSNASDTYAGSGSIAWTMPSSPGVSVALTLSGSAVIGGVSYALSGLKVVKTVSALPTISVSLPTLVNGTAFSRSSNVTFAGTASASPGYPSSVLIASMDYRVNSGASVGILVTPGNAIAWNASLGLNEGLNTVELQATDNKSNTLVAPAIPVLVDGSPPSVSFAGSGGTVPLGAPLNFTLTETEGDLDFTSVVARFNGTTIAAVRVAVSGSNHLGTISTYAVSLFNVPAGRWTVGVYAKDLAGNSGSGLASVLVASPGPVITSSVSTSSGATGAGSSKAGESWVQSVIARVLVGSGVAGGAAGWSLAILNGLPRPVNEPDIPPAPDVRVTIETTEEVERRIERDSGRG